MEWRSDVIEEDTSDDDSSIEIEKEGEWMDEDERAEIHLLSSCRSRKRRKNGKEDAILGVFGSDDELGIPKFSSNPLASDGIAFSRSVQVDASDFSESGQARRKVEASTLSTKPTMKSFGGFGAKMLAKMGHMEGKGLGVKAQGITAPIEATARAGRVGLGGTKERSANEKSGKSDGEVSAKRAFKVKPRKPKLKFMTTEEVLVEASGMHVSDSFRHIIDMTGKKGINGTNYLDLEVSPDPSHRLANMACRDLQLYSTQWKQVQDRKKVIKAEMAALTAYIDGQSDKLRQFEGAMEVVKGIVKKNDSSQSVDDLSEELMKLEIQFREEWVDMHLEEIAVAVLQVPFRRSFANWNPAKDPTMHVLQLSRLQNLITITPERDDLENNLTGRTATPYESLLQLTWVPKIRAWLNNEWDFYDADEAMTVIEVWKPVLPQYIYTTILTQVLIPRLHTAIIAWNPKPLQKKPQPPLPHSWLFPWLPLLGAYEQQMIYDVKERLDEVLGTWKVAWGVVDGLDKWTAVIAHGEIEEMLIRQLLPKLTVTLRNEFVVDPANQDMSALDEVLKWRRFFRMSVLGQLFESDFFPKWLSVLHGWLISSPDLAEVQQWYDWWKYDTLPPEISGLPIIQRGFAKGFDMINTAISLGNETSHMLPPPSAGPSKLPAIDLSEAPLVAPIMQPADDWATFRDVVEEFCAEHELLFIPLRKAHEATGNALHRITSFANGMGGLVCFLQSDVLWAQRVGDRTSYEPLSLDEVLQRIM